MSISIAEFQTAMDIFGARKLPDREATRSIILVPCYIVKDTIFFHSGTDYIVQENPDYVALKRAKQKLDSRKGNHQDFANLDIYSLRGLLTYVGIICKKQNYINSTINKTYSTLLSDKAFATAVPIQYDFDGSEKLQELRKLMPVFDKTVCPFADYDVKINPFMSFEKYLDSCIVRVDSPIELSSIDVSGNQYDFSLICDNVGKTYYSNQVYTKNSQKGHSSISHTFFSACDNTDEILYVEFFEGLKVFLSLKSGLTWRPHRAFEAQIASDSFIELVINQVNLNIELLQKRIISHIVSK